MYLPRETAEQIGSAHLQAQRIREGNG